MESTQTEYSPYLSRYATRTFSGADAAEVAEQIIKSDFVRREVGINGIAGYRLHSLHLGKAVDRNNPHGLERELTVRWSPMETLPQERRGETNSPETRTIYMKDGKNDKAPNAEWEWRLERGKLVAHKIGQTAVKQAAVNRTPPEQQQELSR